MSLIVLTSAGHSPGVTTTALGLALSWPRPVLLVDADPHPSQSVLAGYLRGEDPFGTGLWALLAAHRERRAVAEALPQAVLDLPATDDVPRHFLPGFANPGMVELFAAVWPEFAAVLAAGPADVIVDAGRLDNRGLPPALLGEADVVQVVTRTSLVDLVQLRLYLPLLGSLPPHLLGLLLIGPGRPYTPAEITRQFGVEQVIGLPWAPKDAAVWSHGAPAGRRFGAGGYARAVAQAAGDLAGELASRQERIGAPR